MSVALKRVAALTGGKQYTGWVRRKDYDLGNMCSTSDGRAIECSINQSNGNVFVRFAASVGAVIGGSATFGEPTVITTIPVYDDLDETCGVHICLIDGKLYMTLMHYSTTDNRLVCSLWCDATGSGEAWAYKAKISNCASVGRTSFLEFSPGGCSPLIRLSNGWLACGVTQYIPELLPIWQLDVCVSTDGGATWSAPVGGVRSKWLYSDKACSRTIWEIYPGLIVGSAGASFTNNYIGLWSSYGSVFEGYQAMNTGCGPSLFTTDDGTIYLMSESLNLRKYTGQTPPTLNSICTLGNWTPEDNSFGDYYVRSVISDPVGKIAWTAYYGFLYYGGIFPAVLERRVRNTRHLTDDGWVRSKGGRYMYADGYWKRVII